MRGKWIALAVSATMGISYGAGCRTQKPTPASSNQPPSAPAAPSTAPDVFFAHLPSGFQVPAETDETATRLLVFYGAVLVARGDATPPPVVIFANEDSVERWQAGVKLDREQIRKTVIELQTPAMTALREARKEAQASGADITPRGNDPARRSYADNLKDWLSRVKPGLMHWVAEGRLDRREAQRVLTLEPAAQTEEILRMEKQKGLYFNLQFDETILSSVAPPGASQHLSMLALDINEYGNAKVRAILARHGWFQTVPLDLPHFAYLGVSESELPGLGLRTLTLAKHLYWVPDLGGWMAYPLFRK